MEPGFNLAIGVLFFAMIGEVAQEFSWKDLGLGAIICAVFGGMGASFSALRKSIPVRQMLSAVFLGCFLSSCIPFVIMGLWPGTKWYIGAPIAAVIGLLVFGIMLAVENSEKKIGQMDITFLGRFIPWLRRKNGGSDTGSPQTDDKPPGGKA